MSHEWQETDISALAAQLYRLAEYFEDERDCLPALKETTWTASLLRVLPSYSHFGEALRAGTALRDDLAAVAEAAVRVSEAPASSHNNPGGSLWGALVATYAISGRLGLRDADGQVFEQLAEAMLGEHHEAVKTAIDTLEEARARDEGRPVLARPAPVPGRCS